MEQFLQEALHILFIFLVVAAFFGVVYFTAFHAAKGWYRGKAYVEKESQD